MAEQQTPGAVQWIDHVVVGTNDMNAWVEWAVSAIGASKWNPSGESMRSSPGLIGGLTTLERQRDRSIICFLEIGDGSCHFGAFLQKELFPPSEGLGKGTPRYGFFVRPEDIDEHLRRLDEHGIAHTPPVRTAAEGDEGTAIRFEDPDGNQFEFWAPERMPDGAMEVRTTLGVGRISSAVYGARDLARTAAFFERFCGLQRLESDEVPEDCVVLPLAGGARLVYNLVDTVDTRVVGHREWDGMHAALTLPEDAFFPTLRHMWDGLPEGEHERMGLSRAEEDARPARTEGRGSPTARKWRELYGRRDGFYDWDGHAFHFVGGIATRADGSLAVYRPKESEEYLKELEQALATSTLP